MTELSVGMRVKVVAPDPNGGRDPHCFVGRTGIVIARALPNSFGYSWEVEIDNDSWPFTSQELAPLDENPGATVIEGVVEPHPWQSRYGVFHADGDGDAEYVVPSQFVGKRVRVTIEVLNEGNAS